ncbi:MAG TPA: PIN domain-containing protein, partial [Pyrinomonadaceae bacterium]|nr:PIN domain-containing protein [Pyrinomonadaceae bacterium]
EKLGSYYRDHRFNADRTHLRPNVGSLTRRLGVRTNFVLIDSENVKPEFIEKLKHEHFQVVVFVGANLKRLDFPIVNALQSLGFNGSYVQISNHGPSALDFHIAYYLGKLSVAHPDAYFHIISKDKGFDPLIKHLKNQKIFCSRWESVLEIPLVKSANKVPSRQRATDFYKMRIASAKSRPATVTSLHSAILSHFHRMLSEQEVAEVLKALTAAGHVVLNGRKVTYPDRC